MISLDTILDQTIGTRQLIVKFLKSVPTEQADIVPPTWKNNARWHAGHLLITPALLTNALLKKPLGVPEDYRRWFAKGTNPSAWGDDELPAYHDLVDEIVPLSGRLIEGVRNGAEEPFLEPYTTSVGIVLKSPAEAVNFSMMHDGIHLGMLLALKRALQASH